MGSNPICSPLGVYSSPQFIHRTLLRSLCLSSIKFRVFHRSSSPSSRIKCMAFDDIGVLLAVGSMSGVVHVYDMDEFGMMKGGDGGVVSPVVDFRLQEPPSSLCWHPLQPDFLLTSLPRSPFIQIHDLSSPTPSDAILSLSPPSGISSSRGFVSVCCFVSSPSSPTIKFQNTHNHLFK